VKKELFRKGYGKTFVVEHTCRTCSGGFYPRYVTILKASVTLSKADVTTTYYNETKKK